MTDSILGKPISLINTPEHQRYWLPNRDFLYDIRIVRDSYGKRVAIHKVINNVTQVEVIQPVSIPLDHPRYAEISNYAQQLAEKKFPKRVLRDRTGKKLKDPIVYIVVDTAEPTRPLTRETSFLHEAQAEKATRTIKYPGRVFEILEIEKQETHMPLLGQGRYWNVVNAADYNKLLMGVSTTSYVAASNRAHELRRQNPKLTYDVIRTDILEPYKTEGK